MKPKATPTGPTPSIVPLEVPAGIRMLKLAPQEYAQAKAYNEGVEISANYVEKVWCHSRERYDQKIRATVLRRSAEEIENAMRNRIVKPEELIAWYRAQADNMDPQA